MKKNFLKFDTTDRGFAVAEFVDLYGSQCSLQKSSLATDDAIWLGVDKHFKPDVSTNVRMHLSRAQVRQLLPVLQRFVDTGNVGPSDDPHAIIGDDNDGEPD